MSEILVEVDLPHPPDRVWRALTDPDAISSWFLATGLLPEPGVYRASPGRIPGFTGPFDIEVVGVQPARSLLMRWHGEQLHAQVAWEIETVPSGSRLTVRQTGYFGVNGTMRRRELRRAYQEMLEERLPEALERLAQDDPAPRPAGSLTGTGRARAMSHDVDNELPSAAPPLPPPLDEPSDPWALSDPMVSAGVALPLLPAQTHARPTLLRRLAAAFPIEERVRAAAVTTTAALIVVTAGWLWLTRPARDLPPIHYPQESIGPIGGGQPGLILPSGGVPGTPLPTAVAVSGGPVPSAAPVPSGGTAPQASANPSSGPAVKPLTASYATESSTGLLGYTVKVTLRVHNPGDKAHTGWTVVLTVPSAAEIKDSSATVDVRKDDSTVTITPKDAVRTIGPGGDLVFDVTFGGGALLGIGSGGVTACTIDGAACTAA